MVRLLTDLPRYTGVGQYVWDLTRVFPGAEVFYRKPMNPSEYESTPRFSTSVVQEAISLWRATRQSRLEISRTHVTWEGWGPVYGKRTRLVSVHQVIGRQGEQSADGTLQRWLSATFTIRGLRAIGRLGTEVVVPTQAQADRLSRLYQVDPSRISIVPGAADVQRFRPGDKMSARRSLGIPSESYVVLHVGTDDIRKDSRTILRSFLGFRKHHPCGVLVKVGHSFLVESFIRSRPANPIIYVPEAPKDTLPLYYQAADLLFMPSLLEGFPYPPLEAMASGTPVLTSDIPAFREQLGDFYIGCPPGDVACFISQMERFAKEGAPYSSSSLRNRAAAVFSLNRFGLSMSELYRRVDLS